MTDDCRAILEEVDGSDAIILSKSIDDAVSAERRRCVSICSEHISALRRVFQNDVARALEQVRTEINGGAA